MNAMAKKRRDYLDAGLKGCTQAYGEINQETGHDNPARPSEVGSTNEGAQDHGQEGSKGRGELDR
jgi:hypothetical protein